MGEMRERNASGRERKGSRGGKEESKQSEICRGRESVARAEIIAEALRKTAKGTALAFFGLLLFGILDFASKVLIARHASQAEYGIFSLALSLLQICTILSCLGLQAATPRCIAFFRGRGDLEKARSIVFASLQLALIASVLCGATLFLASPLLTTLFHLPASATQIFQIFAVALPFSVAVEMLASVFRGYDRVQEKVIFRDILSNVLKVLFIMSAIALGYALFGMICAYLLSIIIASLSFTAYTAGKFLGKVSWGIGGEQERTGEMERNGDREEERKKRNSINENSGGRKKELLLFSAPLLVANLSSLITLRIDILMLGYFINASVAALYNAAYIINQLLLIFLNSMIFIYMPISSQLYSMNLFKEMRRCYIIATKWTFSATFPIFLIIFIFSEDILRIFFGYSYVPAGEALRILALGSLIHVFLGPNTTTLISAGRTKMNMIDNIIGAATNISFNFLLIPSIGILGASIAFLASSLIINMLKSLQIFLMYRIHPFGWSYLKPILSSCVLISLIYLFIKQIPRDTFWSLILFYFIFSATYIICLIITRSIEAEDMLIFSEIKRRTREMFKSNK